MVKIISRLVFLICVFVAPSLVAQTVSSDKEAVVNEIQKYYGKYDANQAQKLFTIFKQYVSVLRAGNVTQYFNLKPDFLVNEEKNRRLGRGESPILSSQELEKQWRELSKVVSDLSKLSVKGYRQKGETGVLLVQGSKRAFENAYVFQVFYQQGSSWKLGPSILRSAKSHLDLFEPEAIEFYDKLPRVSKLSEANNIKAYRDVHARSYAISLEINGIDQNVVGERSETGIVLGGLKNGSNQISWNVVRGSKWINGEEYTIKVKASTPDGLQNVFEFQSDQVGKLSKEFTVQMAEAKDKNSDSEGGSESQQ